MDQQIPHKFTPLAIIVTFILTIPGLVLGQVVAFLYGLFLGRAGDGNLIDWVSGGWFTIITMAIIPNAISGGIGGFFGIKVTYAIKPLKQANYEIVAYAMAAIVVAFSALGISAVFYQAGMSMRIVETIANAVGIVAGLFIGQQAVRDEQKLLSSMAQT